jgi:hypothetical protein
MNAVITTCPISRRSGQLSLRLLRRFLENGVLGNLPRHSPETSLAPAAVSCRNTEPLFTIPSMPWIVPHLLACGLLGGSTLDPMRYLSVFDRSGNETDYETEFVPRIGERIELQYSVGRGPMQVHYFRVKDVLYCLQAPSDNKV